MFYIKQSKIDDCGYACLKMLLAAHYKSKDYLFIPNPKNSGAYSYKELINISKDYGLLLAGIKIKNKQEVINNKDFPLILTLKEDRVAHAVILEKIKYRKVFLYDPYLGKRVLSLDEFYEIWDGSALIKKEEIERIKMPESFILINPKDKIISHVLQICSSLLCVIGVYFLGDEKNNFIALSFLISFIVMEIISKLNTVKLMKKMDDSFLETVNADNYKDSDLLINYENYKRKELTSVLKIVFSLFVAIFITMITVINGVSNLIFIGVTIAVSIIKNYVVEEMIHHKYLNVLQRENNLIYSRNIEEYKVSFDNLHKQSYKIGAIKIISKYSGYGIIMLSVFITMAINKLSSVTFLMFYSFMSMYLLEQLDSIFNSSNTMDEYQLDKVKLINSFNNVNQKDR